MADSKSYGPGLNDSVNGLLPKYSQVRIPVPVADISTQTEQHLQSQFLQSNIPQDLHKQSGLDSSIRLSELISQRVGESNKASSVTFTEKGFFADKDIMANKGSVSSSNRQSPYGVGGGDSVVTKSSQQTGLSCYLIALRPWSLPASLIPVALGSCLAFKSQDVFSISIFLTTVLTALCVHAAGNLVNTYCDFFRGIDNKKSDDRTLVDSILQPNDVARLGGILYIAGCFGFAIVNFQSPAKIEHLALIYFCGLSSSFLYTGGLGLKYIAMGDILIVLTFGPLSVVFSYLSQTGQLSLAPLLYAVPMALNTEAILHCNNTRDMEGDRQAGAITLAILLGRTGSYILFSFLLFAPYILFIIIGINFSRWILLPAASIFIAFGIEKQFRRGDLATLPQQVAQLNLVMGLLYILSLYLSDWKSLSSMTQL